MASPRKGAAPAVSGASAWKKSGEQKLGAHGRITKRGTTATGQLSNAGLGREVAKQAGAVIHQIAAPNLHVSGKGSAKPPTPRKKKYGN